MALAALHHIDINDKGQARVAGTGIKVRYLAELATRAGLTPQQIRDGFPQLSLAQIHAALAHYYDHQERYDAEIAEGDRLYEEGRGNAVPSPFAQRMRAEGRLP